MTARNKTNSNNFRSGGLRGLGLLGVLLLTGCALTRIDLTVTRPDGTKLAARYVSTKDLLVETTTNGTFRITGNATQPTDATTRQISTVFQGLQNLGVSAAKP